MTGKRRASRDKTHPRRNQHNSHPAGSGHMFMQDEFGDEGQQHVADGGGGKDVGQVRPGKGSHVGGEKSHQQQHSQRHPGMDHREDYFLPVIEWNLAQLAHATGEQGVARGAENHHSQQHQVLTEVHSRS